MVMNIIEALKKAQIEQKAIRLKNWHKEGICILPTNSEPLGIFLIVENGKKGTRYWNPSAKELTSNEWELL